MTSRFAKITSITILIFCILIPTIGCKSSSNSYIDESEYSKDLNESVEQIYKSATSEILEIEQSAEAISILSDSIVDDDFETRAKIKQEVRSIEDSINDLYKMGDQVSDLKEKIKANDHIAQKLEKQKQSLEDEITNLESKRNEALFGWIGVLVVIGLVAIGAGAFLAAMGNTKLGVGIGVGGATISVASYAFISYSFWVGIAGLGLLVVLILAGFGYSIWKKHKAVEETVETTQMVKTELAKLNKTKKDEVFEKVDKIQSNDTKKLIRPMIDKAKRKQVEERLYDESLSPDSS